VLRSLSHLLQFLVSVLSPSVLTELVAPFILNRLARGSMVQARNANNREIVVTDKAIGICTYCGIERPGIVCEIKNPWIKPGNSIDDSW
jgi:hypothetical protein